MREGQRAIVHAATSLSTRQQALDEPIGAILERVVVRTAVAATTHNKGWIAPGETRNPVGPYLHGPKPGRGIAGIRSDIASGKLSMAALGQMKTRDVMTRWGISETQARRARAYVSRWGLGGAYRDAGGQPKPRPRATSQDPTK